VGESKVIMISKLKKSLAGQPAFRYKQVDEAVFKQLVSTWDEASNLPKDLIQKLNKEFPLEIKAKLHEDSDVLKAVIELEDGVCIETVLMRYSHRNTVCLSVQAGCPLGCHFCATGQGGFKRDLTVWEIILQALYFGRILKEKGERIDNVVFMGMGEPFLNTDNVLEAVKILNAKEGLEIAARSISISTVGITEGIKKLADFPLQINLAVSLHAPNDKLRLQLMPIAKKYSIAKIFKAMEGYIFKTNRKVMIEYIMIDNLNDHIKMAKELAVIIKAMQKPLVMVNLIPYNETDKFQPSSLERIEGFRNVLLKSGIDCIMRKSFGKSISGACGQLAGR